MRQSPQALDALLVRASVYQDSARVRNDVLTVFQQDNSLKGQIGQLVANDGRTSTLLQLLGTIPIYFRGAKYNIPVSIYLPVTYPHSSPTCYVTPTPDMRVKANHLHVDLHGMVYLPYLNQWNPRSSLSELVTFMSSVFSQDPPVYRYDPNRPAPGGGGAQQQRHQQQQQQHQQQQQQQRPQTPAGDTVCLARAVFAFKARDRTELALTEGDLISVSDKNADTDQWWKGKNADGRVGIFPAAYVREIDAPDDLDFRLSPNQANAVSGGNVMMNDWKDDLNHSDIKYGKIIGQGSFGKVYAASLLGTDVAVKKMILKGMFEDQGEMEDFKNEVRIMRKLRHPNIVEFLGVCLEPGQMCIITEFCHKGSVEDLVKKLAAKNEVIRPRMFLSMCHDMARGLNWLHHKCMIHRDLKTANLLIDQHDRIKLADFGLSHVKKSTDMNKVGTYGAAGTPCYMAPEVLAAKPYDVKADVFSFAICCCEMLSGQYPFQMHKQTETSLREGIINGLRPKIPQNTLPAVRDLIQHCWAGDSKVRPNIQKICDSLDQIEEAEASKVRGTILEDCPEKIADLVTQQDGELRKLRAAYKQQTEELSNLHFQFRQSQEELSRLRQSRPGQLPMRQNKTSGGGNACMLCKDSDFSYQCSTCQQYPKTCVGCFFLVHGSQKVKDENHQYELVMTKSPVGPPSNNGPRGPPPGRPSYNAGAPPQRPPGGYSNAPRPSTNYGNKPMTSQMGNMNMGNRPPGPPGRPPSASAAGRPGGYQPRR